MPCRHTGVALSREGKYVRLSNQRTRPSLSHFHSHDEWAHIHHQQHAQTEIYKQLGGFTCKIPGSQSVHKLWTTVSATGLCSRQATRPWRPLKQPTPRAACGSSDPPRRQLTSVVHPVLHPLQPRRACPRPCRILTWTNDWERGPSGWCIGRGGSGMGRFT